jgi:hypothetical protein
LPTGDVLATGGVGTDLQVPGSAVKEPQIWSVANGRWNKTNPQFGENLAPDPWVRNYHSTAVLLPDATILNRRG